MTWRPFMIGARTAKDGEEPRTTRHTASDAGAATIGRVACAQRDSATASSLRIGRSGRIRSMAYRLWLKWTERVWHFVGNPRVAGKWNERTHLRGQPCPSRGTRVTTSHHAQPKVCAAHRTALTALKYHLLLGICILQESLPRCEAKVVFLVFRLIYA